MTRKDLALLLPQNDPPGTRNRNSPNTGGHRHQIAPGDIDFHGASTAPADARQAGGSDEDDDDEEEETRSARSPLGAGTGAGTAAIPEAALARRQGTGTGARLMAGSGNARDTGMTFLAEETDETAAADAAGGLGPAEDVVPMLRSPPANFFALTPTPPGARHQYRRPEEP